MVLGVTATGSSTCYLSITCGADNWLCCQASFWKVRMISCTHSAVWTVDFATPACKLYLLFISAKSAKEKEKRDGCAAAC
jgi:hypothetical protein